ncbi:hypothetical protein HYT23_01845 [Candidatus Pacearchaeota archaeon]|nr:hypothetical protein [Candidatus Pacearchaeota archaeon]
MLSLEETEEKIAAYLKNDWNYEEIPIGPTEINDIRIISPRGRVYNVMDVIYPKFANCYLCSEYFKDNPSEKENACFHNNEDLGEVKEARTLAELLMS